MSEDEAEVCEYVPTSQWTGDHRFPRWAVCKVHDWRGPTRRGWADAEADYCEHAERMKHDREGIRWLPIEATPLGKEWSG